jgi:hypothetical protein
VWFEDGRLGACLLAGTEKEAGFLFGTQCGDWNVTFHREGIAGEGDVGWDRMALCCVLRRLRMHYRSGTKREHGRQSMSFGVK